MSWRILTLIVVFSCGAIGLSCSAAQVEQPAVAETPTLETPTPESPARESSPDTASESGHPETSHPAEGTSHESHGDHDETDLSHQNAGAQLTSPSEFKRDLALWTFVLFILLLLLLTKFAWRPVMEGLDKREASIAALVEEAKLNAQKSAELMKQHEARLNAAADEVHAMIAAGKRDAETLRERILADAQSAAQRERDRAVSDIQAAKTTALHEMTQRSVDIAFQLANGIVRRQLNPEDHAQLIRETMDRFENVN